MSAFVLETMPKASMAILTMPDSVRPFRGNHINFIDLIRKGRELGAFVFVVTPRDLKLGQKRVHGYVYNIEQKTWTRQLLPLPQVIYNRIPTRKDEQQPEVQQTIKACLKNPSISLFNPFFFNKWSLFEWLHKSKATRRYIPATKKLASLEELEDFLQKHTSAYLKPVRGKAGKGIMKVQLGTPRGKYWCRLTIQDHKNSQVSTYDSPSKLWAALKQEIGSEEYIIQQGIKLARAGKRPFDLRVLVQKNHNGDWGFSGVGARVAGKQSITTHVPRGGRIDTPEKVLTSAFGGERTMDLLNKVKETALLLASRIEKASGEKLGEMSMDLGIDTDGRLWFFEANSRPMKFDEPDIRRRSLERIIQYSLHLSNGRVTSTATISGRKRR